MRLRRQVEETVMQVLKGMLRGPLVIDRDTRLDAMVSGDVIVRAGCRVEMSGMVSGDVLLAHDAEIAARGMIAGRIVREEAR